MLPSSGTLREALGKRKKGERTFRIRQVRLLEGEGGPFTVVQERHRFICVCPDELAGLLQHKVYAEDKRIRALGVKIHNLERERRAAPEEQKLRTQIKSLRTQQGKIQRRTPVEAIEIHEVLHGACFVFFDIDTHDHEGGRKTVCWLNKYLHVHLEKLRPHGGEKVWGSKRPGAPFLQILYGDQGKVGGKFSAHILGSGCVFPGPEAVGRFVELILRPAARDHPHDPCLLVGLDMQVYKKNQCFRISGSSKLRPVFKDLGEGMKRGLLEEVRGLRGPSATELGPKGRRWACLAGHPDWAHPTVQSALGI